MSFTSLAFITFFIVVFVLYWLARTKELQNGILLAASYLFMGWMKWEFAALLFILTLSDYLIARKIASTANEQQRKNWLWLGVGINFGSLLLFKYFNFFSDAFQQLFSLIGFTWDAYHLHWLLPLGISFYTLKKISYLLDIHRKTAELETNFVNFALYAAFFPQAIAGPIEPHRKFFPQIAQVRTWQSAYFHQAWQLLLMGFFKKIVIADNIKIIVDKAYQLGEPSKIILIAGTLAFTVQILMDFSAYTDLARGFAFLLGLDTSKNFERPYLALTPTQFWDRWHITFSNWLRDYIFFPIYRSLSRKYRATKKYLPLVIPPLVTMLASGLWHGAGYTYVAWGAFHGLLIIIYQALGLGGRWQPKTKISAFFAWLVMFTLIVFSWSLFRASTLSWWFNAWFKTPWVNVNTQQEILVMLVMLLLTSFYASFLVIKLLLDKYFPKTAWLRGAFFAVITILIVVYTNSASPDFIYAQF